MSKLKDIEILLFSAPWCEPCKAFKPHFADLATKYPGIVFDTVDVSVEPKTANMFRVRSVPTVLIVSNGDILDRLVNPTTAEQVEAMIRNL